MSVCARCVKVFGGSCCEVREGERLATLTHADVDRVREATGLTSDAFCETEWLAHDEAIEWSNNHLLYRDYFAVAPKRLTLKRRDGACVFHVKGSGCSLSADERPTACRLYPFEPRADGSWGLSAERFGSLDEAKRAYQGGESACLAVEEADSFEALRALFSTDREQVEAIAEQLRAEVLAHARRERRFTR